MFYPPGEPEFPDPNRPNPDDTVVMLQAELDMAEGAAGLRSAYDGAVNLAAIGRASREAMVGLADTIQTVLERSGLPMDLPDSRVKGLQAGVEAVRDNKSHYGGFRAPGERHEVLMLHALERILQAADTSDSNAITLLPEQRLRYDSTALPYDEVGDAVVKLLQTSPGTEADMSS